ncbi:hypothetical protein DPM19_11300 [Actinomadura craniellae]|uniref:Uncharacterized protein n=1 Tax=Actinomadura craniellae TaxID=2231787 RepID=A0A365H8E0_9ACTN|nr:hypothetical protein [Actinomadura craniellae]RAY15288.1 hypothetical protein DPM19_11300 [Actinomadura craniellae]
MYVIRLPNGKLRVPHSATSEDGRVIGQAYVDIGPDDPDYTRLLDQAVTEEELEEKRRRWREDDEALRRQFEEWKEAEHPEAP